MLKNYKYIILFNGPPRSGKDTLSKGLDKYIANIKHLHFAEVLKNLTHRVYGLYDVPFDHFEIQKDILLKEFLGKTPRECYIQMSEHYLKPLYGNNFFVEYTAETLKNNYIYSICDCGFDEEVKYLSTRDDIKCIYIILQRDGKNFDNDSRKYINIDYINKDKDSYLIIKNEENNIDNTCKAISDYIKNTWSIL